MIRKKRSIHVILGEPYQCVFSAHLKAQKVPTKSFQKYPLTTCTLFPSYLTRHHFVCGTTRLFLLRRNKIIANNATPFHFYWTYVLFILSDVRYVIKKRWLIQLSNYISKIILKDLVNRCLLCNFSTHFHFHMDLTYMVCFQNFK